MKLTSSLTSILFALCYSVAALAQETMLYASGCLTGLYALDTATLQPEKIKSDILDAEIGLSNVNAIFEDRQHNFWIGCDEKGLAFISCQQSPYKRWNFMPQKVVSGSSTSAMCQGANGSIWVVVRNNGLYRFDSSGQVTAKLHTIDNINTIHRGLIAIDTATGKEYRSNMYDTGNRLGNLCNDWIFSMYYDSKDFYWHRCRTLHIQPPHQLRFSVCRSQGT